MLQRSSITKHVENQIMKHYTAFEKQVSSLYAQMNTKIKQKVQNNTYDMLAKNEVHVHIYNIFICLCLCELSLGK
jgi:uncharacterized alkaline shock family protein YloU